VSRELIQSLAESIAGMENLTNLDLTFFWFDYYTFKKYNERIVRRLLKILMSKCYVMLS